MLSSPPNTLDELEAISQYNSCLRELLDKHAPVKKRRLRSANHKGWYTDLLHSQRQHKRALQRKYNKSKDPDDLTALLLERDNLKKCIVKAKSDFYQNKISEVEHDKSALVKCVKNLLHQQTTQKLPDNQSPKEFCDSLNNFFITKIDNIRKDFADTPECLKQAIVSSILKKPNLENIPKNY